MDILYAFFMTWGMFLSIPCPVPIWREEARGLMLVCFPVVGLIVGAIWSGCLWLSFNFLIPDFVRTFAVMAVPYAVTGFIHLDGFCDVCDAVMSRRDLAERQRILKDSRVGAFAVVCLVMLLLFCYGASMELKPEAWSGLLLIPVISRGCAGAAVLGLRPLGTSQYSGMSGKSAVKIAVIISIICAVTAVGLLCSVKTGIALVITIFGYIIPCAYAFGQLDGMSGDISGFSQTLAEAAGLAALCCLV